MVLVSVAAAVEAAVAAAAATMSQHHSECVNVHERQNKIVQNIILLGNN